MNVYLSFPRRDMDAARELANELRGHSPADEFKVCEGNATAMLWDCDYLIFADGWAEDADCQRDSDVALRLGTPRTTVDGRTAERLASDVTHWRYSRGDRYVRQRDALTLKLGGMVPPRWLGVTWSAVKLGELSRGIAKEPDIDRSAAAARLMEIANLAFSAALEVLDTERTPSLSKETQKED